MKEKNAEKQRNCLRWQAFLIILSTMVEAALQHVHVMSGCKKIATPEHK